ncbi:MAG: beta-lactamase family protein [Clostridia bacterium]|nr:beta-lactamase family protein [Clostridia bacterium]
MSLFLEKAKEYIKDNNLNIYRITEICNGTEETLKLQYANPCQNVYSVAKVFATTAIMILYDRGIISLDEKVCQIFKNKLPSSIDEKWYDVTVDHLLTHRAGFSGGQLDIDCLDSREFGNNNYLELLLSTPLISRPGEKHTYSDAAFYMVSRIVAEKIGMTMDDFLWKELFIPCGFREVAWSKCPQGHAMGATGLYVRTDDLAKLGQIYLSGGVYKGKRILSEKAVETVLKNGYELTWRGTYYAKGGMRGSMLQIIPDKNRVVAWTACDDSDTHDLLNLGVQI